MPLPVRWDLTSDVGRFLAKPFNFFVSPMVDPIFGFDRSFLCQASAIDMLCKEKLDFNRLFRHGIRYLSRQEEKVVREAETDRVEGNRENAMIDEGGQAFLSQAKYPPPPPNPPNFQLSSFLNIVAHTPMDRMSIQNWLEDPSTNKYPLINVAVTSSYYKRLLHQSLPEMFPNLMIANSKRTFLQITDKTAKRTETLKFARQAKFEKRVREAVGLRRVIDCLVENRSVVVGHNAFQDFVFVWSQFIGSLPETLEGFCKVISEAFPKYSF